MEPGFSSFSGYLTAILFLQIASLTSAVGMEIQMTVQVPDTGGFLIECNSGGWLPHTEVKWIDSKGNTIPHASKHSFQDGTGLFNLRMSVLLRNSTHGPVTCCFSNPVTGQEKRASIVIPVIWIKRSYADLVDILLFAVFIVFLFVYFEFRRKVSVLQELYPFYAVWTKEIWIILIVLLSFFIAIIYFLLYSMNEGLRMLQTSELSPEIQEHNRIIPENPGENILDQEL